MGLLALAQIGRDDAVSAVSALESQVGTGNLKLTYFRGLETLIPPDVRRLMTSMFFWFDLFQFSDITC